MRCECNQSDEEFGGVVRLLQKAIRAGEIFQVVPSRRFSLPCPSPLAAYYVLKKSNPSPYMFFMQDNDFTLFGASPESSLKNACQIITGEIHQHQMFRKLFMIGTHFQFNTAVEISVQRAIGTTTAWTCSCATISTPCTLTAPV